MVAPAYLSAQIASSALVIEGGTLIDGNGGPPLRNAAIVVEGDRITDVGVAGEIGAAYRDGVLLGKIRGPRAFTGISRFTTRPAGDTGLETVLTPGRTPSSAEDTRALV